MRIYRLNPLDADALGEIVDRALTDPERGLGGRVRLSEPARATLIDLAGGDARGALNILDAAAAVVEDGTEITPENVAEAAQQRLLAYDRVGDQHYEAASAFIKSMRGNDPDAAQYALAQAAAYVASAPKSNRAGAAYFAALAEVEEHGRLPVPLHLRPAAHRRLTREFGYGKGYLYPHDYDDADVEQQYLPDDLAGRVFYEPSEEGLELKIGERLQRLRRKRLEARRAKSGNGDK